MTQRLLRITAVLAMATGSAAAASGSTVAGFASLGFALVALTLLLSLVLRRRSSGTENPAAEPPDATSQEAPTASPTKPFVPGQGDPEEAGAPRAGWFPISLAKPIEVATSAGETLQLGTDLEAQMTLEIGEPPEGWDPIDPKPIVIGWRLADESGQTWEARSFAHATLLTQPLEEDEVERSSILFWHDAPKAWHDALAERCVLKGATDLLDGRERFDMPVGDYLVTIMHKYQGPHIDVGLLQEGEATRLVVRCAKLYYDSVADTDGNELAEMEDLICMAYLLDPVALLPATLPELHHEDLDDWADGEDGNGVPFAPL